MEPDHMVTAITDSPQAATRSARDDRFAGRAWLHSNSTVGRCRSCGRGAVRDGGVSLVLTGTPGVDAAAGFSGVSTCASVWICPKCAADIQAGRAAELSPALAAWLEGGHGLALVTVTAEHHAGQGLAEVWGAITYAWSSITTGAAYNGQTKRNGTRVAGTAELFNVNGWMRAIETNHGGNGWHVHAHALFFTARPLTLAEAEALEDRLYPRWSKSLERKGLRASRYGVDAVTGERKGLGVNVRVWGRSEADAAAAAFYPHKAAYSAASWLGGKAAGAEALLSAYKRARRGNRPLFTVLGDLVAAEDAGLTATPEYARDRAIWAEWEAVAPGKRQIGWSKGIREALGLIADAVTDEALAEDDVLGGETVCTFLAPAWLAFSARWERPANLLTIAEQDGPDAARAFAADYLGWAEGARQSRAAGAAECDCRHRELGRRAHLDGCARRLWADAERVRDHAFPRVRAVPAFEPAEQPVDLETGEILGMESGVPWNRPHGPYGRPAEECGLTFYADRPDPEVVYDVPEDLAPTVTGTAYRAGNGATVTRAALARAYGLTA
jgi:hypothetical protein